MIFLEGVGDIFWPVPCPVAGRDAWAGSYRDWSQELEFHWLWVLPFLGANFSRSAASSSVDLAFRHFWSMVMNYCARLGSFCCTFRCFVSCWAGLFSRSCCNTFSNGSCNCASDSVSPVVFSLRMRLVRGDRSSTCTTCKKLFVFKGPSQGIPSWYLRRRLRFHMFGAFLTRFMRPWQDARKRSVRGVYAIVWPNVYASSWVLCVWCFLQIALLRRRFRPQNVPDVPRLPHKMDIAQKNEHGALLKLRCTLCVSLRSRNAHRHLTMTLLCENLQQKCRGQRAYPDLTPALLTTVRTPQCGHTVWGTTRIINLRIDIYSILYIYSTRGYTGSWVSPLRKGWSSIGSLQCPPGCCQR